MKFRNINVKECVRFDTQRREVAHLTSLSWKNMPHVSYVYEPDITEFYDELMVLSDERKKSGYNIDLSILMIKVVVEGLLSAPKLNSYIEYNYASSNGKLYILDEINVALPWLLPDGRIINPNILNAENKSLNEIAEYISNISKKLEKTNIDELLYRAAENDAFSELRKLNLNIVWRVFPSELTKHKAKRPQLRERAEYYRIPLDEKLLVRDLISGTVTISNYGAIYGPLYKNLTGYYSFLNIMPPQTFIVGMSVVQERPTIFINKDGAKEIGIRKILPMCLVFDHRAFDLDSIFPFVRRLDEIFSKPKVIHEW